MRHLTVLFVLAACSSKSFEQQRVEYRDALQAAAARETATYQLLARIRGNLARPTPACSASAEAGWLKLSENRLRVITGEPLTKDGELAGQARPTPNVWDDTTARQLVPANFDPPGVGSPDDVAVLIAKPVAAIRSAPGFLVQVADEYQAPHMLKEQMQLDGKPIGIDMYQAGRIAGRIVAFDAAGTPRCHWRYEASSSDLVTAHGGNQAALDDDLRTQLGSSLERAISRGTW
ncbi:MAG TPA: hypothetical protein VFQ53_05165 [Kofleriaceae bacterium]|nr:hypothetical protein [Kofleriaceae bacterium]